jgi:hypothetical protein
VITLALTAVIIAALLFLVGYLIVLVKEWRMILRRRKSVAPVESVGHQLVGREAGTVVWSPAPALGKVALITHSGRWRRTTRRPKESTPQTRLEIV